MRWLMRSILAVVFSIVAPACATTSPTLQVGSVAPSQAGPSGEAPGAQSRLIGAQPDGVKFYVLVFRDGDEVATGLSRFAREQALANAHFVAIGAVRDPRVAWFDRSRGEYRSIARQDQMEVLALSGDVTLGADGQPASAERDRISNPRGLRDELSHAAAQTPRSGDEAAAHRPIDHGVIALR